jgi:F0F1-type ATP synthase membrane subunit b/b'
VGVVSDFEDFADLEDDLAISPAPSPYQVGDAEQLILRLRDLIANAPNVPLSSTPRVAREEVLDLLDEAIERLPEELRAARWLLKEREEYLDKVRHEGEEIIAQARDRAERMVQRTEVVKAAEQRAYQILDSAEADARRLRHEVEDFCDQKLASFEIVLERTQKLVSSGRAKLQGTALLDGVAEDAEEIDPLDALGAAPLPPPPPVDAEVDGDYDSEDGGEDDGEAAEFSELPPPPPPPVLDQRDAG